MQTVSPERRLPKEGEVFSQRYRVEELLGAGGMGSVVAATDLHLSEKVALKILLPSLASSPEICVRFLREARAGAALESEHATRILDGGWDTDGTPYLVMELLHGADIREICRVRGPLPVDEAIDYLLQACHAVGEAHSRGIVHRDLKPGNLFLADCPGGAKILKVLDFGLAKAIEGELSGETGSLGITQSGVSLGTPIYMSPEQFRDSKRADRRADVWALGMILYRMIAGRPAFSSSSVGELLELIAHAQPTPLRAHRPDAPAEVEAILHRCLAKAPSDRFSSAGELARALMPFAPPPGWAPASWTDSPPHDPSAGHSRDWIAAQKTTKGG